MDRAIWIGVLLLLVNTAAAFEETMQNPPQSAAAVTQQSNDRILAKLAEVSAVDANGGTLREVFAKLAERHQIDIRLHHTELTDAGVNPDEFTPSVEVRGKTLQSTLAVLLRELELDYYVADESLHITTYDQVAMTNLVRIYELPRGLEPDQFLAALEVLEAFDPAFGAHEGAVQILDGKVILRESEPVHREVAALISAFHRGGEVTDAATDGPHLSEPSAAVVRTYFVSRTRAKQLAETIQSCIAPASWVGQGGTGAVQVVEQIPIPPPSQASVAEPGTNATPAPQQEASPASLPVMQAIIVRQTRDIQREIAKLVHQVEDEFGRTARGTFSGGGF